MKSLIPALVFSLAMTDLVMTDLVMTAPATAQSLAQSLIVVYPPANHETTAKQIFLIGSAPQGGQVLVNGKPISRSSAGHFAPSFPLNLGENQFTVTHQGKTQTIKVTRTATTPSLKLGMGFAEGSLQPAVDLARLPGETVCLGAVAAPNAIVKATVKAPITNPTIANQTIPLLPQQSLELPDNKAVLTGKAQTAAKSTGQYGGCVQFNTPGTIASVDYQVIANGKPQTQTAPGKITILNPVQSEVVEVTADAGVARTGASTDFSRLSPLPKGTRASVTGQEGEWLRLDYGGWIKRSETKTIANATPPRTMIRGVTSRPVSNWTEVVFPLQTPVPTSIQQDGAQFVLSLFNVTAQTDTIKLINNPVIDLVNWQQTNPNQIDYRFKLKSAQQWGYKLRYEGSNLILSLKNPPAVVKTQTSQPLKGLKILLDPGHGGPEDSGSVGLTGYPEKDATLYLSKQLRDRLTKQGATVIMTREGDIDLLPNDRAKIINQTEPTIAISIHFNALPDDGDAIKTSGMSAFWYHPQAHSLADFLHDYVTRKLGRKSDGVFWNNLAVTRPAVTPSVLLELGYMINPVEFEWIRNPQEQQRAADALADGIVEWFKTR
jgi:N-acetylmuramoyl-L-alanine amidase